jgi:hypothetical protein
MELQREVIPVRYYAGFFPDQNIVDGIDGTIIDGENVWIRGYDRTVSDTGPTLFGASGGGGLAPLVVAGGQIAGLTGGYGSVTSHNNTDWFAGLGSAYKNGVLLGASAGRLYLMSGGVPLEAGLDATTGAPVIDANGSASSKGLSGTYSVRLAPFRLGTGAKGNAGPASNIVAVNGKKIRINSWASTVTGQTHWGIYLSFRGYGLVGPHFRYKIITLAEAVTNYEIDFYDNELTSLAPFTSGKCPACTHCAGLGPMMLGIGTYGGYGVSPSLFNLPEEFDPAHTTFLAKKEAVTGVGSGSDGSLVVATRNSLSGLVMSGNDFMPVLVRGIWENVGFAHGNGFTIFEDNIMGMAGRGPVMSQGAEVPDTTFATPVMKWLKANGFTAQNTHVCHDYNNNCFFLCSGNYALPYMRGRRIWSTPVRLSGAATGAVTIEGQGLVQIGGNLYSLNTANGGSTWYAQGVQTLKTHHRKTARYWHGSGNAVLTIDIMANKGASVKTLTQEAGHSKLKKFVKKKDGSGNDIKSLGVKVSGTTGGQEFEFGELTYLHEPAMR